MSFKIFNSNETHFRSPDNAFTQFMRMHCVRYTLIDNEHFFAVRDIIDVLGYSPASIQHLTKRCPNKRKIEIEGRRGMTNVNFIPASDFLPLVLSCPFPSSAVRQLKNWIIEQGVLNAKGCWPQIQPKDVSGSSNSHNPGEV
ncbi:MAG: BRO family protein [Methyloligellaceae bacterium]